ncbi:MAG: hypothetical protein KA230_06455 [Flavobacteriales bacterium]|nr:hypothetical protein [Flavobacteriales bacterium]
MYRLCAWCFGVPVEGRAYDHLRCTFYRGHRSLGEQQLMQCDVLRGYRTHAHSAARKRWLRTPDGFICDAAPLSTGAPYVHYGWQAAALPGGACGGFDYDRGPTNGFRCRMLLRRRAALLEHLPLLFHYKCGVVAERGVVEGTHLVPPRRWLPVPAGSLTVTTTHSSDGRFVIVNAGWVGATPAIAPP